MNKIITKKLKREDFNKIVEEIERTSTHKLGIKKVESCVFYSYIDKNFNTIKLICDEYGNTELSDTYS